MSNGRLISIVSLYNWDNTIFDGIRNYLPSSVTDPDISLTPEPLDFDTLIGNIMFSCGELSIIYNRPETLKLYLELWARKNKLVWQKLFDTLYYNYDPLFARVREYTLNRDNTLSRATSDSEAENNTYNRDIVDSDVDVINRSGANQGTTGNTRTLNTTENTNGSESQTETVYKQAYNDIGANWSADSKTEKSGSSTGSTTDTGTITDAGSSSDEFNNMESERRDYTREIADTAARTLSKNGMLTDTGKLSDIITEKITGQRAYQELIDLQRRLAMFNLYDFIIDQFKAEFCMQIY